jgi:hypothetical protein
MDDRNDRRRDRLSWAEIDKLRDKSKSRDRDPMQKQSSPAAINAQKSYRAALERAFAAGKLDELAKTLSRGSGDDANHRGPAPAAPPPAAPVVAAAPPAETPAADVAPPATPTLTPKDPEREQKQKLLAKIRESEGRDAATRSVDAYIGKYGKLPDDIEILTKCLGHKSDERVSEALERLTVMINKDKPRRARTLAAQLRILEDTHGDPEIRACAAKVRGRL